MDPCAELTLRLVRAGQEALNPLSAMRWVFFPEHQLLTWSEARDRLAAADKPLIIGPLLESGSLAIWSFNMLEPQHRTVFERELENQREYFSEKLTALGLGDADQVETPDGEFTVTVREFRRWATEYAINVGIGMTKSPAMQTARILIRPPGGGRPPIGWIDPARPI